MSGSADPAAAAAGGLRAPEAAAATRAPSETRAPEATADGGGDASPPPRGRLDAWRILDDAAERFGDRLAVVDCGAGSSNGDGALLLTYAQLRARAARLAAALARLGAARGARVAVLMRNRAEVLEAHFAAAALHAVVVNVNTALAPAELEYVLGDSGAALVLAAREFGAPLRAALDAARGRHAVRAVVWADDDDGGGGDSAAPPPDTGEGVASLAWPSREPLPRLGDDPVPGPGAGASEDDALHLYFTSGTTGRPKGVLLSHRVVALHALGTVLGARVVKGGRRGCLLGAVLGLPRERANTHTDHMHTQN